MKEVICVKCGKPATRNYLCEKHLKEEIISVPDMKFEFCRKCGSYFFRGRNLGRGMEALASAVQLVLKRHADISDIKHRGKRIYVNVNNIPKSFLLKTAACILCSRLSGGYHEAVIQVRGANAEGIEREMLLMKGSLAQAYAKKTKHGANIYFIKKSDAARIAKNLRRHFSVKHTSKLVGQKKDRRLYRDVYAVR